jgi:two-component system, NarL family, sensor histidine kinase UhpB
MAPGSKLNYHCWRLPHRGPICNAARTGRTCISTRSASRAPPLRLLALPSARRLTHALWYGRSVRAQLLIAFILIDLIAGAVAGAVTILQARRSTRVEIAASMELAQLLVSEAVALMQQAVPAEKFLADLASPLQLVRHVRIVVKDANGAPLAVRPPRAAEATREARAPAWFAALIAAPSASRDVPVVVNGARIGSVEIVPEPRDEIAEVWGNTVALGTVALIVNIAVIGMLYVLFGRVLDPLTGVTRGLADLERRNYQVRLPRPRAHELAAITDRFNALAQALDAARTENERLTHRLITAQDDERRRTALELHDEVGPSLFGLKANASSIATAARELPSEPARKLAERARDMLAIIEHLQSINRSMLNRLRPMALGHVPLQDILSELVHERGRQHPQIAFSFSAGKLLRGYGDSIDLTVYRCVQESLTNAIRHAQASKVAVEIAEADNGAKASEAGGPPELALTIRDDGRGIDPTAPPGFGTRGMRERVQALGGSYRVESARGSGTCVRIAIPLHDERP